METREVRIKREGKNLVATLYKKENDNCIVLFHGGFWNRHEYFYLAPKLSEKGYNVLAADFISHGDSARLERFRFRDVVESAEVIISWAYDHVSESVGLFGSSLGALTTLYASKNPKARSAIVSGLGGYESLTKIDVLSLYLLKGISKIYDFKLDAMNHLNNHLGETDKEFLENVSKDKNYAWDKIVRKVPISSLFDIATQKVLPAINDITIPLLILDAKQDLLMKESLRKKLQAIEKENITYKLIKGAGHFFPMEKMDECVNIADEWYKRTL